MSLEKAINDDIKAAMLAKDKKKLEALRAVKAAILLAKTDKGSEGGISEDAEMKLLMKWTTLQFCHLKFTFLPSGLGTSATNIFLPPDILASLPRDSSSDS